VYWPWTKYKISNLWACFDHTRWAQCHFLRSIDLCAAQSGISLHVRYCRKMRGLHGPYVVDSSNIYLPPALFALNPRRFYARQVGGDEKSYPRQ
jgi:hypothetical protein